MGEKIYPESVLFPRKNWLLHQTSDFWFQFFGAVFAYKGYPFRTHSKRRHAKIQTEIYADRLHKI